MKKTFEDKFRTIAKQLDIRKNSILFAIISLLIFGSMLEFFSADSTFYAYAYSRSANKPARMKSPIFDDKPGIFDEEKSSNQFAQKIYAIVGDAPIREMVPFISERNEKVAAFLVGIAKKESGLGRHSPLKDGRTCYNYWGYNGSAGRGTSQGFACFASAEEAVEIVGNRIEVLVNKNRTTPDTMVHTWKCGTSCAGDSGAPSWVSTVTTVFDKILG